VGRDSGDRERLSEAQFIRMWNDLIDGDATGKILTAWIAKGELRALLATAQRGGQRHDVAHRLHRFNSWCAASGLPELERLAGTIEAWWPEVLGFLQTQVTNAGTEATNRTVKTAARTAYGFRNLDNQRRRVRFACTRRSRRAPPAEGDFPLKFEGPTIGAATGGRTCEPRGRRAATAGV
jgi:transposase